MPYKRNNELPNSVTNVLPTHAQAVYREAFNSAWNEYKDPGSRHDNAGQEEVAYRVAWRAVKKAYSKGEDGKWHPKN